MSININSSNAPTCSQIFKPDKQKSQSNNSNNFQRVSECCHQNDKINYSMQQLLLMMNNLTKDDTSKEIDKKVKEEMNRELELAGLTPQETIEAIKQKMNKGNAGADRFYIVGHTMIHITNDGNGHLQTHTETLAPAVPLKIPQLVAGTHGVQKGVQKLQMSIADLMSAISVAVASAGG
ncbi:hypothetical protein SOPP22_15475 [Shewanella sp. OPT22]|nr:hypothetical protein SOPP22_15475 [Shewanella sp. OPT22]